MSDGLPERLDSSDEMLDYERTAELLREAAAGTATEVVDRLLAAADAFSKGRAAEDDVTLVAVRRLDERGGAAAPEDRVGRLRPFDPTGPDSRVP